MSLPNNLCVCVKLHHYRSLLFVLSFVLSFALRRHKSSIKNDTIERTQRRRKITHYFTMGKIFNVVLTIFFIQIKIQERYYCPNMIDKSRFILKDLRNVILVADENGQVTRYIPQPDPVLPQPVIAPPVNAPPAQAPPPKKQKAKKSLTQPSSTPKCDEMAAKMPSCKVSLLNLSMADITAINVELAQNAKIRSIEKKNIAT